MICTEHFWLCSTELPHLPAQRIVFMHGMSSLLAQQLCLLVPGQVTSGHVCRRGLQPGTTSAQPSSDPSLCSTWSASYLSRSHTMRSLQHPDYINLSQELLLDSWGPWAVLCSRGIYSPCSSQVRGCFLRDTVIESCSNSCDNISGVNSLLMLLENPCQADTTY